MKFTSSISKPEMLAILQKKYPTAWFKDAAEFSLEHEGQIWSGEGTEDAEGNPLFDYYAQDPEETNYVMGVKKELAELLLKHGWYTEFYDPGTVFMAPEEA